MSNNLNSTSFFILIFFIRFIIVVVVVVQVQEEFGDHPGGECRYLTGNEQVPRVEVYGDDVGYGTRGARPEVVLKLNGYSGKKHGSYLDYVKSWKIYGSSYYFVSRKIINFPSEVKCNSTCLGDHLTHT